MSPAIELRLAHLPTISFSKLAQADQTETKRLLSASSYEGFFYLDLAGPESQNIELNRRSVLDFMEKYFAQPIDVKMKDDRKSETHGYKPTGRFAGAKENQRDLYETLKVHREELVVDSPLLPVDVQRRKNLFDEYIGASQQVTQTILARLSDALGVPEESRFEHFHRDMEPTRTALVMLSYPPTDPAQHTPGVGHNKHTDIGSLTLLFSDEWGLQVLSPSSNRWEFVEPRPGYAIINIGDSLRFLSGNSLNSCVHRGIPIDGESQLEHRYSIAYFLRAEDKAVYRDSNGRMLTALDWHDGKYTVFAQQHNLQAADTILTGGMEKNNLMLQNTASTVAA